MPDEKSEQTETSNEDSKAGVLADLKRLRPTRIIVEIAAAGLCLLVVSVLVTLIVDQVRTWTSDSYRSVQMERRDFFCATHFDETAVASTKASPSKAVEEEVQKLLETARLRASPTDSIGKFRQFFLCASVSKISLKSVEITQSIGTGGITEKVTADNAAEVQGRLKSIKKAVKHYPDNIYNRQRELLSGLIKKVEQEVDVASSPSSEEDNNKTWILIAGADQSDDAALNEVKRLQTLIDKLPPSLKAKAQAAQIYRVRSWRRTVAPFNDKESVVAALENLKPNLPYGAYIRSVEKWCSELVPQDKYKNVPVSRCGP